MTDDRVQSVVRVSPIEEILEAYQEGRMVILVETRTVKMKETWFWLPVV